MTRVNMQVGRVRGAPGTIKGGYANSVRAQMKQIRENLKRVINGIENITPEGLKYAMQPISDTSQTLVPKDTYRLMKSHFFETRRHSRGVSAYIGYARADRPHYAFIVHERIELRHAAPTQAKFLEQAVNMHVGEITGRYARFVKKELDL